MLSLALMMRMLRLYLKKDGVFNRILVMLLQVMRSCDLVISHVTFHFIAVVDGRSLEEIYEKVKQVIHDNSSDLIWVPSNEEL